MSDDRKLYQKIIDGVFSYSTPKTLTVRNRKLGFLYRILQLALLVYISYSFVVKKEYQTREDVVSSVTIKVKGISRTNGSGIFQNAGSRTWDPVDFAIPPQTPNSVFIMTNMWITNQTQGICPEKIYNKTCTVDSDCACGNDCVTRNGILTGICDNGNNGSKLCLAYGWCPIEVENKEIINSGPKLLNAPDFTVLIKNTIQFPTLRRHYKKRNLYPNTNLENCTFDFGDNLYCPIFTLKRILNMANCDFEDVGTKGAVLGLLIEWNCNLDKKLNLDKWFNLRSHYKLRREPPYDCEPHYRARRLDFNVATNIASPSINFRYGNSYINSNGILARQLIKAYGIWIKILVSGEGKKFDRSTILFNLGASVGIFAFASFAINIAIHFILKETWAFHKKINEDWYSTASFVWKYNPYIWVPCRKRHQEKLEKTGRRPPLWKTKKGYWERAGCCYCLENESEDGNYHGLSNFPPEDHQETEVIRTSQSRQYGDIGEDPRDQDSRV